MRFTFDANSTRSHPTGRHPLGGLHPGPAAMAAPPVVLIEEPRSLDAPGGLPQDVLRGLVYDEIDVVLTRAFGGKWQRAMADVCGIDHRYLRRAEFLDGLLPPAILLGIRDLAMIKDPAPIGALLSAFAWSRLGEIDDTDVSISLKLYRMLRG